MDFKRKYGETVGEMAIRIQILYGKLEKIEPLTTHSKKRNMRELFFKGLPETVRDYVGEEKDFDENGKKV